MSAQDPVAEPAGSDADTAPVPSHRGLKTAVIVMGVLLVVGFVVLFSAIVYRAVKLGEGGAAAPARGAFGAVEAVVAADARVRAVTLDGNRLAVTVEGERGGEVILFDVRSGRELGRIRLKPAP